jgi:hypothetical protein
VRLYFTSTGLSFFSFAPSHGHCSCHGFHLGLRERPSNWNINANDQLSRFNVTVNSLTLTDQAGTTVSLLNSPIYPEFIHINSTPEPLATVSVPQDTYISATATLGPTTFTCLTTLPDGILASELFGDESVVPTGDVTVSLPTPITVTGANMALSLDMLVSQSASFPDSCYVNGNGPFTLTPAFKLTPMVISAQPSDSSNGKLYGLEGVVASTNSEGMSLNVTSADGSNYGGVSPASATDPANGPIWNVAYNASTVFQGVTGSAQLATGMPVDMDVLIQADGSLLASRITVYDTQTTNTSLWIGPVAFVVGGETELNALAREQTGPVIAGDLASADFANAIFNISRQLPNLASLPFQPSFTSANMVAGQIIAFTFHTPIYPDSLDGPPAVTITLLPQTINGTVSAVSTIGGFTSYNVTLASYDLFPALAVQSEQTSLLTEPGTVIVYVDNNTQLLNSTPLAAGSTLRFNGLVFNDHGTLRMDCDQISDGVTE